VDREGVLARCRGLPAATEGFPFGDSAAVFKVGGKMFAIVELDRSPARVSLKCDPGYAIALREQYAAVSPGYHLAKRYWNTVALDNSVPDDMLDEWIRDSYDIVLASLTRAERAAIAAQSDEAGSPD
jgi:predicted DNA-binding protein (MmcQ/YjbR family)